MQGEAAKGICFGPIIFVSAKRVAKACQVGADLVLAACVKRKLKQGELLSAFDYLVVGPRLDCFELASRFGNKGNVVGVVGKGAVNGSRVRKSVFLPSGIFGHGAVKALGDHRLPRIHNRFLRAFVKREHHNAACVFVQTVDGEWPMLG